VNISQEQVILIIHRFKHNKEMSDSKKKTTTTEQAQPTKFNFIVDSNLDDLDELLGGGDVSYTFENLLQNSRNTIS
jgi:hypothetical protein